MGVRLTRAQLNQWIDAVAGGYDLYAPKRFPGGGRFADTDCVRYAKIERAEDIEWAAKSDYSFKEALTPVSQTLFFFTENQVKEADAPGKPAILFLRACDLHALKRLDDMYLHNGNPDYYYARLRERLRLVHIGCRESFENCFCVSMGTNVPEGYDMSLSPLDDGFLADCPAEDWASMLTRVGGEPTSFTPDFVRENSVQVRVPDALDDEVAKNDLWREYDSRCIACGRCNFVCPTCTCYTMQDLFYSENGAVGERRRVMASCMVDGFTNVAGGGAYREKYGDRMRFKVLHKVLHHKKRFGRTMCVGCGRCDDICPEYISFSHCVNRLAEAVEG